jgi:hypothetical protein
MSKYIETIKTELTSFSNLENVIEAIASTFGKELSVEKHLPSNFTHVPMRPSSGFGCAE